MTTIARCLGEVLDEDTDDREAMQPAWAAGDGFEQPRGDHLTRARTREGMHATSA